MFAIIIECVLKCFLRKSTSAEISGSQINALGLLRRINISKYSVTAINISLPLIESSLLFPLLQNETSQRLAVGKFHFENFFIILGIKNERINRPMEKNTLKEISSPQLPDAHTSFSEPIKNVKMNVPTVMPSPVPAM